jgi:hypothetical protein
MFFWVRWGVRLTGANPGPLAAAVKCQPPWLMSAGSSLDPNDPAEWRVSPPPPSFLRRRTITPCNSGESGQGLLPFFTEAFTFE